MEFFKNRISNNNILLVLQNRTFSYLMLAEIFSQFAFNMQQFVLIYIVYQLTQSNTAVSAIILSFTIPAIFCSLVAGVLVDRWNKKQVLLVTTLVRGILLIPFLIPTLHVSLIYFLTFLVAIATQFFLPAESAIIPTLVSKKQLVSANAIYAVIIYTTVFGGYIAAGPFLLVLGRMYVFLLLIILFFVSAICISFLPASTKKAELPLMDASSVLNSSFTKELREVFSFIKKAKKVTHALTVITISQAIVFIFAVLGPGYVSTILHVPVESLSLILLLPAGLGMVTGAFIIGSYLGKRLNERFMISAGFIVIGIIFLFLPFGNRVVSQGYIDFINRFLPKFLDISILHIMVVLGFIAGLSNSFIFIPANATLQGETSDNIRGRIYGFLNGFIGAVSLLPVALAGGLADIFGVSSVITVIGALMIMLGLFWLTFD